MAVAIIQAIDIIGIDVRDTVSVPDNANLVQIPGRVTATGR